MRFGLRTEGILMPGILPALLFALHFHAYVVCACAHGAYAADSGGADSHLAFAREMERTLSTAVT